MSLPAQQLQAQQGHREERGFSGAPGPSTQVGLAAETQHTRNWEGREARWATQGPQILSVWSESQRATVLRGRPS